MKKLTEFTEQNARAISFLLPGFSFSGYSTSENEVMIEDALDVFNTGEEKAVYIYSTGKVSFYVDDGGTEGRVLREINQLPITDYLRERGFNFNY